MKLLPAPPPIGLVSALAASLVALHQAGQGIAPPPPVIQNAGEFGTFLLGVTGMGALVIWAVKTFHPTFRAERTQTEGVAGAVIAHLNKLEEKRTERHGLLRELIVTEHRANRELVTAEAKATRHDVRGYVMTLASGNTLEAAEARDRVLGAGAERTERILDALAAAEDRLTHAIERVERRQE